MPHQTGTGKVRLFGVNEIHKDWKIENKFSLVAVFQMANKMNSITLNKSTFDADIFKTHVFLLSWAQKPSTDVHVLASITLNWLVLAKLLFVINQKHFINYNGNLLFKISIVIYKMLLFNYNTITYNCMTENQSGFTIVLSIIVYFYVWPLTLINDIDPLLDLSCKWLHS